MNDNDAVATQHLLCGLSDDPDMWRRAPFTDLYGQCMQAKYGDDGGGLSYFDIPF